MYRLGSSVLLGPGSPNIRVLFRAIEHALKSQEVDIGQVLAPIEEGAGNISKAIVTRGLASTDYVSYDDIVNKIGAVKEIGDLTFYGKRLADMGVGVYFVDGDFPSGNVIGVDGSSRLLSGNRIAISVVSTATAFPGMVATLPSYFLNVPLEQDAIGSARVLALQAPIPDDKIINNLEDYGINVRPLVYADRNTCSKLSNNLKNIKNICMRLATYWGYQKQTMTDENRLLLETLTLFLLGKRVNSGGIVLSDGPVFVTPALFERLSKLSIGLSIRDLYMMVYALSYTINVILRVITINNLWISNKINVIGVVKRLENSKHLLHAMNSYSTQSIEKQVSLLEVFPNDAALIDVIVSKARERRFPAALVVGPLLVELDIKNINNIINNVLEKTKGKGLEKFMENGVLRVRDDATHLLRLLGYGDSGNNDPISEFLKIIYKYTKNGVLKKIEAYVIVPLRPDWAGPYTLFRLEAPIIGPNANDYKTALSNLGSAIKAAIYESFAYNANLPQPLIEADQAAKRVSKALAINIFEYGQYQYRVSWDYETRMSLLSQEV